ncbi:transcriptional regulator [Chromobacterium rhizoryzae]|uniref:Transcriptional regulator n=1 Tax=Chromobacterium rhizoryzae TaxID=1778675 RepID=A0AAD0RRC8_9NEIS|nr:transcriptional regulator [Chromobacterium rhizoryzae]
MDACVFIRTYGVEEASRVAIAAGTSLGYFKQIASCHRYPSRSLAHRLVKASDGRMDLVSLMTAQKTVIGRPSRSHAEVSNNPSE